MSSPRPAAPVAPPAVSNAFTVDLEEWFHVCGVGGELAAANWDRLPSRVEQTTLRLLDLLDSSRVRATFFVVGWVAERHPRLIERVQEAGHQIGCHGHWHRRAYDLGPAGFREDLRTGVAAIEAVTRSRISCFRAPEWSINDRSLWALEVLVEEGFAVDASMAPVKLVGNVAYPRRAHTRVTGAGALLEVPPLVADRFGQAMPMGWGWGLRMSSPRRVLKTIEAANTAGHAAVLTVHPWEIDPDPPRVRLPPSLHFAHYFRLSGFRERLREVVSAMPFGSIADLASARHGP
jgi:polysaccharide deacetylase family protein (PEP-CTERM system associated)